MYEVVFSKKAEKEYKALDTVAKKRVNNQIKKLEFNPYPKGEKGRKKLRNSTLADFRVHANGHRILYDVYEEEKRVHIIRIRKKDKNTYKN